MLHRPVNGYDMAYIEVGQGDPLVCIHGSLNDYRIWSPVLGPLSRRHRVITPSMRHYFPEHWDGTGGGFTMAQHVADTIAFLETLGGPVDLLGHSRGGHIAFRVAEQRPDLSRRLILAEPGGDLDHTIVLDAALWPERPVTMPPMRSRVAAAVEKIAGGDIDGALIAFMESLGGPEGWRAMPEATKQQMRDNAFTLLGQVNEHRQPFSLASARAIRTPALFVGGSDTDGPLPIVLRALAAHVPGARTEIIPNTTHWMFAQEPTRFSEIVLAFLAAA